MRAIRNDSEEVNTLDLFEEAVLFAVQAHSGMVRRRESMPYILHPLEVAAVIGSMSSDRELLAAGVLHDTVEDAGVTSEEIAERFGKRVAELVAAETEDKRPGQKEEDTWQIRKEESLQVLRETKDRDIKILWLGDKLSNMRSFYRSWLKDGDALWQSFHQKDPARQEWYYRTIAELLIELKDYPAWQEYNGLVNIVFGNKEDEPWLM